MLSYKKPAFWIIIAAVIACIVLAAAFLTNPKSDILPQGHWLREGLYLPCENGADMIIVDSYGPISMTPDNPSITFDDLTAGDKIRVELYTIEESYPAHAVIYGLEKLADGEYSDIDAQITARLTEMGWLNGNNTGVGDTDILYERFGLSVPLPYEYSGKVVVADAETQPNNIIITVYQKAAYEKNHDMGWLFSIVRHSEDELISAADNAGGLLYFANDGEWYYALTRPTDVQADMSDPDSAAEYETLSAMAETVMTYFTAANGLEAVRLP